MDCRDRTSWVGRIRCEQTSKVKQASLPYGDQIHSRSLTILVLPREYDRNGGSTCLLRCSAFARHPFEKGGGEVHQGGTLLQAAFGVVAGEVGLGHHERKVGRDSTCAEWGTNLMRSGFTTRIREQDFDQHGSEDYRLSRCP